MSSGQPSARPITDDEAEAATLGACLLATSQIEPLTVEVGLRAEHFYRFAHATVWTAMTALTDDAQPVDVLTVARRCEATSDQAPGDDWSRFIDQLTGNVPSAGNAAAYARRVLEVWRWEQSRRSHLEALAAVDARDRGALDAAEQAATRLLADGGGEHLTDPKAGAAHMIGWLEEKPERGLPLPWPQLERAPVRLRPGHMTVLGGWTSSGKSAMASTLAAHVGRNGHHVVIWDNELTREERWARHVTSQTGVNYNSIVDRDVRPQDVGRVVEALRCLPFGVVDAHGWSAQEIARHVRQVKPALAIVDHFHALPGVSRTDEADAAVQVLVAAAGQAKCHVLLVAQLNQARNDKVGRPPPVLRDLRGTGNLSALPSNVIFVHREEEELRGDDDRPLGRAHMLESGHIDVAKQRGGAPVTVAAVFDDHRLRWLEEVPA
jgi:replicative DNA helicase